MTENLLCPFDNTPLKKREGVVGFTDYFCPNCNQEYSLHQATHPEREREVRIQSWKRELDLLQIRQKELTDLLSLIQEQ